MSFDPIPYNMLNALGVWSLAMAIILTLTALTLMVTTLVASGATGPLLVFEQVKAGFGDWLGTSWRRVWAVTMLTFRESMRRKTLGVFAVFAILFLFAGWFLNDVNTDAELQVRVYVSFVLRAISWLILPVVLLLACWGLPEDIKNRSLHTVVTKPIRRHEIVLGRILGISIVGSIVLAGMSVVGYIWIERQLPESMKSKLVARVPVYGLMSFKDREGNDAATGVNTGDEWMFRSYVEGNTKARAIWDFQNIDTSKMADDKLPLESSFQAFRTYKGNLEKGLLCQYTFINEERKIRAPMRFLDSKTGKVESAFEVSEFREQMVHVNRKLLDENGKEVDLFTDIVQDGKLRVEARCLTSAQFIGMARPDLFVRLPDRPFAVSFFKGIFGIGLMMVMIVVMGVMASCFLKGPVATFLTFFVLLIGRLARPFLVQLTSSDFKAGGVIESIYRIIMHLNPVTDLEQTPAVRIMQGIDRVGLNVMWALKYLFPDFSHFNMTEYVAKGFDVPFSAAILPSLALTVGYTVPWILVGYFSLKLRELEAK